MIISLQYVRKSVACFKIYSDTNTYGTEVGVAGYYSDWKTGVLFPATSVPLATPEHTRHVVAQLLEAVRYKSEVRGLDSRLDHVDISLT